MAQKTVRKITVYIGLKVIEYVISDSVSWYEYNSGKVKKHLVNDIIFHYLCINWESQWHDKL